MNDHAAPVPSPSHPSERLHALDALRAVAMMLGVWLHAALPFVEGLPPFYWPFVEEPQSAPIGLSVVVIHAWRMETFFLLSGFFTALLIARRGGLAALRQRSLRVLVPFLIALAVIQPLCVLVWSWGYAMQWGWPLGETFESVFKNSWGVDTPGAEGRFGRLYHLWFIYELCVLIGVGLLARWVVMSLLPGPVQRALVAGWAGLSRATAWCVGSWLGAVVLAVPVGAALLLHHPTGAAPNESLAPQWPALVYHALPFFAGWALYAGRGVVDRLARRWWAPAAVGVLATLVHLRAMGALAAVVEGQNAAPAWLAATASHALMTTGYSLAMIGLFTRVFGRPGPRVQAAVRYVSDSAYWVYLAHLPLVIAIGLVLLPWDAPAPIKFGVCVVASMMLLMTSYALLVRHTPIGRLLNGPRPRRAKEQARTPAAAGVV